MDFAVNIKDPADLFRLLECAGSQQLHGYSDGKLDAIFYIDCVKFRQPDGWHTIGHSILSKPKHRLDRAYLITLSWRPPKEWTGHPLEILALAAD